METADKLELDVQARNALVEVKGGRSANIGTRVLTQVRKYDAYRTRELDDSNRDIVIAVRNKEDVPDDIAQDIDELDTDVRLVDFDEASDPVT